MFIRYLVKKISKQEGKGSCTSRKIAKLKSSKEFKYLVDIGY